MNDNKYLDESRIKYDKMQKYLDYCNGVAPSFGKLELVCFFLSNEIDVSVEKKHYSGGRFIGFKANVSLVNTKIRIETKVFSKEYEAYQWAFNKAFNLLRL